jgi:hypothetical protein
MKLKMILIKSKFSLYLVLIFISIFSAQVYAVGPSGVARLSFSNGVIGFLPAGETKWFKATVNRPLVTGDSVWAGANSLLELQLGTAIIRIGNQTNIKILNLNPKISQVQLNGGTLILRIWKLLPNQSVEISTPNLAFSTSQPGYYRIFVNTKSNITVVSVMDGSGKIYGSKRAYLINAGKSCPFGKNLKLYQCSKIPPADSFALWSQERDGLRKGKTIQYVSSEMIGSEDLNQHGTWKAVKKYGPVWTPNNTSSGWAPYQTGHWVWIRQWGWTWVDQQPWGFAPFHYGRWIYLERRWSWVPGPRDIQPVYAPALVVFVGGANYNLKLSTGSSGIAWFPLAPGEIYIPPRGVSRQYFINVNRSNTLISQAYITNVYNTKINNITYQNINVVNAVSAVSTQTFIQSQPVNQALVQVPAATIVNAPKDPVATVTPDATSVQGSSEAAQSQPPKDVLDQTGVVTTKPPAEVIPFSEEQKILAKDPGTPLTAEETEQLKPAKTDESLDVVNPEQDVVPINKEVIEQSPQLTDPSVLENQTSPELQPKTDEQQQLPDAQKKDEELQQVPDVQQKNEELQQVPDVQQKNEELQQVPDVQQKNEELQQVPDVQKNNEEQQQVPDVQQKNEELQQVPDVQQKNEELQQVPDVQQNNEELQQVPDVQQNNEELQQVPDVQQKNEELQQVPDVQQNNEELQQVPDVQKNNEEQLQQQQEQLQQQEQQKQQEQLQQQEQQNQQEQLQQQQQEQQKQQEQLQLQQQQEQQKQQEQLQLQQQQQQEQQKQQEHLQLQQQQQQEQQKQQEQLQLQQQQQQEQQKQQEQLQLQQQQQEQQKQQEQFQLQQQQQQEQQKQQEQLQLQQQQQQEQQKQQEQLQLQQQQQEQQKQQEQLQLQQQQQQQQQQQ